MKLANTLLIASTLLAPTALAGEVQVLITGVVATNNSPNAPYNAVPVGSEVMMTFRVTTPGLSGSMVTQYEAITSTWVMKIEELPALTLLPMFPTRPSVTDDSTGDGLGLSALNVSGTSETVILSIELPATTFASSDIETLAGTYDTAGGGGWDLVGLDADMEITHQTLHIFAPSVGEHFCDPMDANSTGAATQLFAFEAPGVGSGAHLEALAGPPGEFGYFLVGSAPIYPGIPISDGRLCLSPSTSNNLSRYNVTGTSLNSTGMFDVNGVFQNLSQTSTSGTGFDVPGILPFGGSQPIVAGETWYFQMWHREANGRSNFSNGVWASF